MNLAKQLFIICEYSLGLWATKQPTDSHGAGFSETTSLTELFH